MPGTTARPLPIPSTSGKSDALVPLGGNSPSVFAPPIIRPGAGCALAADSLPPEPQDAAQGAMPRSTTGCRARMSAEGACKPHAENLLKLRNLGTTRLWPFAEISLRGKGDPERELGGVMSKHRDHLILSRCLSKGSAHGAHSSVSACQNGQSRV